MAQTRYFTKSKFKLAMECPTKLYYSGKEEYANRKVEDSFLAALADGGFQVGALARCYFPDGILIETPNDEAAATVTEEYLNNDRVTLFEAVFKHDNYLIRCDVVVKDGDRLNLYEVKAKSCDFADESGFLNKKDETMIHGDWLEKIQDVAFQKHVLRKAFPEMTIQAHLMLVDKTVVCSTDGLNQKFPLVREKGRRLVRTSKDILPEDLDPQLLRAINVDKACEIVFTEPIAEKTFEASVEELAGVYVKDVKQLTAAHASCKGCEFDYFGGRPVAEQKSGVRECWTKSLNWAEKDFETPSSLDVWFINKEKVVKNRKFRMSEIDEAFLGVKSDGKPGLSRSQRQWLQASKTSSGDSSSHLDAESLKKAMQDWVFPLHFIDFETARPVIPFLKNQRPYPDIVFQFSHHVVKEDGSVEHSGEYLNAIAGSFPNYDFLRALKAELESDKGTIFRYGDHENSVLCAIYSQLKADASDIPDRDQLCALVEEIAKPTGKLKDAWIAGPRNMVDMHELIERFHYDPATNGSISLKAVLPATLNRSEYLKKRYAAPIYGGNAEIPSKNFPEQIWIQYDPDGKVIDPYKLLPMMFTDETDTDYAGVMEMEKIKDGGAAMTAYGKLQFQDLPQEARTQIESALLKYCELDTLAMVMIYEAWKAEIFPL